MVDPDEMKKKILQWCAEDNIPIKEVSIKSDEQVFHWNLAVDRIAVYCQKRYPDRIFFQNDIKFSPEQITMIAKWDNAKRTNLVTNLSRNSIEFDYSNEFVLDGQNIKAVRIHKFTVGDISKSEFIQTLVRVQNIINFSFNLLNMSMGVEMNLQKQQSQTSSENPLSG